MKKIRRLIAYLLDGLLSEILMAAIIYLVAFMLVGAITLLFTGSVTKAFTASAAAALATILFIYG